MQPADRMALFTFPVLLLIGLLVALAGSQGGATVGSVPLFGLLVGLAFGIQWLAFLPAYFLQTETFFDLTGSATCILLALLAVVLRGATDARSLLLAGLVMIWALRLGTFLFLRIQRTGKDDRFDELKPSFLRFLSVWTIQGLWVTFTAAAALIVITSNTRKELDGFALVGLLLWLIGFAVEVIADEQKRRCNADPANRGRFIRTGLWARSRHPNYLGEILLWLGVAVIALPVLQGWQWIGLLSPLFVALLLTRVSGVPMLYSNHIENGSFHLPGSGQTMSVLAVISWPLPGRFVPTGCWFQTNLSIEQKADKKWGGQTEYEAYKASTPVLLPRLK